MQKSSASNSYGSHHSPTTASTGSATKRRTRLYIRELPEETTEDLIRKELEA